MSFLYTVSSFYTSAQMLCWFHVPYRMNYNNFHFWLLFFFKINLFIYFWLCWVFVSVRGLSLVAASGGHSSSWCAGFSPSRPLLLWSTGSRRAGSVIVAHGPSCSAARGIFPEQGSNPCPLHWQADAQPLLHQGNPIFDYLTCATHTVISTWSHLIHTIIIKGWQC